MKQVAKCMIFDEDGKCLILYLNNHPMFGNDVDLPGGTVDEGENIKVAALREVQEEAGINVPDSEIKLLYEGSEYSQNDTFYALYLYRPKHRPGVTLSWEHSKYEWVDRKNFIEVASKTRDTYMHMAADVVRSRVV